MENRKTGIGEFFVGLRPDSSRSTPKPAASSISNARERTKPLVPGRADAKSRITSLARVESIKSEIMSKIAKLETSLVAEIHESRVREEKLRSRLAKSRVVAKDLQAKLNKYDQADRGNGTVMISDNPQLLKPKATILSSENWRPPPTASCCGDLRQLARNQVIRSVQDISPQFTIDLDVYSYDGYIPWPRVLEWLEDHPETVDTIGLNLHSLRTI